MSGTQVIRAHAPADIASAARAGAQALREGKLVGFATETVYGIAALATLPQAMERLREVKSRPGRPFSVHMGRPAEVDRYVASVPAGARRLIRRAWPGPVTLILPVGGRLAEAGLQQAGLYDVLCSDDQIGLRCPQEPLAEAMLSAVSDPVVAPSANPAGAPSPRSADDVLAGMDGQIDLLIDSGPCRYGKDSTIVRFAPPAPAGPPPAWEVVRAGVLDERSIRKMLRTHWLFVCSGNTCRSPMAAAIARTLLARRAGCSEKELPDRGYEVSSAGLHTADGAPASGHALQAAARLGADLKDHRSRKVSKELIQAADVVFCMTQTHVAEVQRLAPTSGTEIRRLCTDGDLADPIGGGPDVYERTARRIEAALRTILDERDP